jgi:predicted alpha/beta hydrolase
MDTLTATASFAPTTTPEVPYEKVTFSREDGIDIAATLFGKGDTALILLHMGKDDGTQTSWNPFARVVAERGFSALTVDARGRGESGETLKTNQLFLEPGQGLNS